MATLGLIQTGVSMSETLSTMELLFDEVSRKVNQENGNSIVNGNCYSSHCITKDVGAVKQCTTISETAF